MKNPTLVSLVAVALTTLWCVGLFARGWWRPDEPREAALTQSMAIHPDQPLPSLGGRGFAEKPPLSYVLAAKSVGILGLSPASTRAPQLLYAVFTFFALAALAHMIAGETAGVITGLTFATFALSYQTQIWLACDALLIMGASISLFGMYCGLTATGASVRLRSYLLMNAGLTIAFFAKNFAAWLVPACALVAFLLWERRLRELRRWELWVAGLVPATFIGLWVWHLKASPESAQALRVLFWDNLVGRAVQVDAEARYAYAHAHRNWFGKYFVELPLYLIPWTAVVWAAARRAWTTTRAPSPQRSGWRFAICMVLPSLVILSIATTARGIYAAPCLMGVALLVGLWTVDVEADVTPRTTRALAVTGGIIAVVAAVILAGTLALQIGSHQIGVVSALSMAASAFVLAASLRIATSRRCAGPAATMTRLGLAYTFLMSIGVLQLFLTINRWQDLSEIAADVETALSGHPLVLWRPDETTLAWADLYLSDKPERIFYPDESPAEPGIEHLLKLLDTTPQARVLALAPGNRWQLDTWIRFLRDGSRPDESRDLTGFGPFQGRTDFRVDFVHESPGGRRYVLLSHGKRSATRPGSEHEELR